MPNLLATVRANLHLFEEAAFRERHKDNPYVESLTSEFRRPDPKLLDQDEQEVSQSDTLVSRLIDLRNWVLAHRDSRVVLGVTSDPLGALDRSKVDTLRARAAKVVNRYSILYSASAYSMEIVGHDDFKQVLRSVRRDRVARERRMTREIERAMRAQPRG